MRTSIIALCILMIAGTAGAELIQVIAIVQTNSTFYMAYEDNQVWGWGGPPVHLQHVNRGEIAIRDMKRWSTGDMVVLLYEDEQVWGANFQQFWFIVDAHRDGVQILSMDSEFAPQIVCTYTDGQVWIWTDGVWRREESMERETPPPPSASHIRLAFYGWQSAPVGCFDEAIGDTLQLYLPNTLGEIFGPSPYHFGFRSWDNESYVCYWGDTEAECAYDLTAWFEPGSVVIGHVDGGGDQNAMIEGEQWQGHVPTDFTAIRIEIQQDFPCNGVRTVVVPINWFVEYPVAVEPDDGTRTLTMNQNPCFRPCRITFQTSSKGAVNLQLLDVSGRVVRSLLEGRHPAGDYALVWDGRDDDGRELPSGTYFTRVETADGVTTARVVLTR